MLDKKNTEKCDRICGNMQHICDFLHTRHNFRICDSENAIICEKICDMRVLAKYALAYSHITSIPKRNCHRDMQTLYIVSLPAGLKLELPFAL